MEREQLQREIAELEPRLAEATRVAVGLRGDLARRRKRLSELNEQAKVAARADLRLFRSSYLRNRIPRMQRGGADEGAGDVEELEDDPVE